MKRRRALLLTLTAVLAPFAAYGWWLHKERRQYALNRQLVDALEHGDTQQALALVNAGADPDTREDPVPSPSFRLLLDQVLHGKRLPLENMPTALMMACGHTPQYVPEDVPLLQAMLRHKANVHSQTTAKWTALHSAALEGRVDTMELLLKHGAKVNVQDGSGQTPLMQVIHGRHMTVVQEQSIASVRLLFAHGALPNVDINGIGWTALTYAIIWRSAHCLIPLLLENGADPNLRDISDITPLQLAQKLGRPELVYLLEEHGAK